MKKKGLSILLLLICLNSFGQNKKIKIALVSQLDTTFAIISNGNVKKVNIEINDKWLKYFKSNLDSSKYEIQFETMPNETKNNYFLKSYKYTDGFFKASSKLSKWFKNLHANNYEIVIVLGRVILMNFTGLTNLSDYSYGLIQDKNWIFSLNRIITYKASNGVILYETKLHEYSDYIRVMKEVDLSKETSDSITVNHLNLAVNGIILINNDIGKKVCEKIEAHWKSFQKE
jgi:hypothetical protein